MTTSAVNFIRGRIEGEAKRIPPPSSSVEFIRGLSGLLATTDNLITISTEIDQPRLTPDEVKGLTNFTLQKLSEILHQQNVITT